MESFKTKIIALGNIFDFICCIFMELYNNKENKALADYNKWIKADRKIPCDIRKILRIHMNNRGAGYKEFCESFFLIVNRNIENKKSIYIETLCSFDEIIQDLTIMEVSDLLAGHGLDPTPLNKRGKDIGAYLYFMPPNGVNYSFISIFF